MTDPLDRFVAAQHRMYADALAELRRGRKESHWMWFVFPQLRGLGSSDAALFYGIADLDEARAYLAHDLLGPRYGECAAALLAHRDRSAITILGDVDALKLRSSLTLFREAGGAGPVDAVLRSFYDGPDAATLRLLGR